MTVNAWPFAPPDRPWGAPEWRQFMVHMRQPGIIADVDQEMLVEPVAGELQSVVRPGMAFLAGHQVVIDADETVNHETADLDDDRIDLVVLTVDWRDAQRDAYVEVIEGTPSSSPEAPSLTQDDVGDTEGLWQEPLFEVLVEAAAGETGGHTDLRRFMEVPGRVLVVESEAELDEVDPTWHRFAVVDDGGDDAAVHYYDGTEWRQVTQHVEVPALDDLDDAAKGDTAPSSPATGDLWYDTSEDLWKRWDGSAWVASGNATYTPQRLKVERSNKDDDGIFRDVVYRRHDGTAWMESRLRPEGSGPEYDTREVDWFEDDGETVRDSVTYDLSYDGDGDLIEETAQ